MYVIVLTSRPYLDKECVSDNKFTLGGGVFVTNMESINSTVFNKIIDSSQSRRKYTIANLIFFTFLYFLPELELI